MAYVKVADRVPAGEASEILSVPAPAAPNPNRSRRFKIRVNANAGIHGAFNGVCLVFEGDEYVRTVNPAKVRIVDDKGRAQWVLRHPQLATFETAIEEYPITPPEKPLANATLPTPVG